MEMVGLVFIVAIIVVGIILYITFSAKNSNDNGAGTASSYQRSTSFLVALTETDVLECGEPVSSVIKDCMLDDRSSCNDPCKALNTTFNAVLNYTLTANFVKYNLSLEGKNVGNASDCDSADPNIETLGAPKQPVSLGNGQSAYLVLTLCK